MNFLFLFLFLGLFLACFREGVWKMYSPEELTALRQRDEENLARFRTASPAVASPTLSPAFTAPEPALRRRPQPSVSVRYEALTEQMQPA